MSSSSLLSQFQSITSCSDQSTAQFYLDAANNNLSEAVANYLEESALNSPTQPLSGPKESNSGLPALTAATIPAEIRQFMSEEEISAALAAENERIQRSSSKRAGNEGVRAPDAQKHESLYEIPMISPSVGQFLGQPPLQLPFRNFQQENLAGIRENNGLSSALSSNLAVQPPSQAPQTWHSDKLAELFAPPKDLLFPGSFDDVCSYAESEERWLLVNLQDSSSFQCHALNRDVWKNSTVHSIVQQNFIFWQSSANSVEGMKYINIYQLKSAAAADNFFPHIAIIDPRTRQKVLTVNNSSISKTGNITGSSTGPVDAAKVKAQLLQFVQSHNLKDYNPAKAIHLAEDSENRKRKPSHSVKEPSSEESSVNFGYNDDEALQAAIQASLEEEESQFLQPKSGEIKSAGNFSGNSEESAQNKMPSELTLAEELPQLPKVDLNELNNNPQNSLSLQFVLPNRARFTANFNPALHTVGHCYFLAYEKLLGSSGTDQASVKGQCYQLIHGYPPVKLVTRNITLEEAMIKNRSSLTLASLS
jgi:hypothetical protein